MFSFSRLLSTFIFHSRRSTFFGTALLLMTAAVLGPLIPTVVAQTSAYDALQSNGIPNNSTEIPVPLGVINLAAGNLHEELELGRTKQRAKMPDYVIKAVYDSKLWNRPPGGSNWWPSGVGWQVTTSAQNRGVQYDSFTAEDCAINGETTTTRYNQNFRYTDEDGTTHLFWEASGRGSVNTQESPACTTVSSDSGYATDGSGYFIRINNVTQATVYAPDGRQVYPVQKDSNGNFIGTGGDTLGRNGFTQTSCGVNPSGTCLNTVSVPNSNGSSSTYQILWEQIDVCTAFNDKYQDTEYCTVPITTNPGTCGGGGGGGAGCQPPTILPAHNRLWVIQSITLPDKSSYSFYYDSGTTPGHYGLLTGVKLPTGASVSYNYSTFADAQTDYSSFSPNRWVTSYSSGEGTWSITPQVLASGAQGCASNVVCNQLTVTKPSGDQQVYTFSSAGEPSNIFADFYTGTWNTNIQYYNGTASGNPVMAIATNYTRPGYDPLPSSVTVSAAVPGGTLMKQATYTYKPSGATTVINAPKVVNEYGFGMNQIGPLLRTTKYEYLDETNASYVTANITNKPVSKTVFDGSGNQIARTTYEYDNYSCPPPFTSSTCTSGLAASGAAQHDPAYGSGYTVRGNLTATNVWRNTDGTYLTTRSQYDDAGNIVSTVEPKGDVTSYGYADAWGDATCKPSVGSTAAYQTSSTDALGHVTKHTYNSCTGKKASTTDVNNQTGFLTYESVLDRPQQSALPINEGAWTDFNNPNLTTSFSTVLQPGPAASACSGCAQTQTTLDTLGRTSAKTVVNDPDGPTTVKTTYDSSGRVLYTSQPYRGADTGGDTLAYDGVDRTVAVTHADSSMTHTYYGAEVGSHGGVSTASSSSLAYPTLTVDEAGNKHQSWMDALGRLVEVDELGAISAGSITSWSVPINGSEQFILPTVPPCNPGGLGDPGDPPLPCPTPAPVGYDSGTVYLTVNSTSYSYNFGQGDTTSTIAQALVAKITQAGWTARVDTLANGAVAVTVVGVHSIVGSATSTLNLKSFQVGTPKANTAPGSAVNYITLYKYDSLDNLICVEQRGDAGNGTGCASYPNPTANDPYHPRMSTFNSLSQLLTAKNPETGALSYTYDNNGNVLSRTDGRGVTVNYSYDALNRLIGRTTSTNETPWTYTYDQGQYGVYHRTGMTDNWGTVSWSFDALGRIIRKTRTINANPSLGINTALQKTTRFTYNYLNEIQTIIQPEHTITYGYNAVGRPTSVSDNANNVSYVGNATFAPNGRVASLSMPSASVGYVYNSRNQICREIASTSGLSPAPTACDDGRVGNIFDYQYDFSLGNGDNGNLYRAINHRDPTRTQIYAYDPLNRLISAETQGTGNGAADCQVFVPNSTSQTKYWGEGYSYDAWGNLTGIATTACSAENTPLTVNANNQLALAGYDAAGNMTSWATNSYSYSADDRLVVAQGWHYLYDGDGQRLAKTNTTTGTIYWDDIYESDLAGNNTAEYVAFNGERLVRKEMTNGNFNGNVRYYYGNHLNNTSVITDASGNVLDEDEYYPYGTRLTYSENTPNHFWFGGKERDETGFDYFGARHYSSSLGRFASGDWTSAPESVPYADLRNPQTLNLYGYVGNNPTTAVDATGHVKSCLETSWTNPDGSVTVNYACIEIPDQLFAAIIGVGHHFWPQSLFRGAEKNLSGRFFNKWVTGRLRQHGWSKEHSAYNKAMQRLKTRLERDYKKELKDWDEEDINKAVQEVREAGGDVEKFLNDIAKDNPGARTVMDDIQPLVDEVSSVVNAVKSDPEVVEATQAVRQIATQIIEACEEGGCIEF